MNYPESMEPQKRYLLIVDDEPDLRDLLRELAEQTLKCEVFEAENGAAALKWIEERLKNGQPIDAVLSDVRMPVMDGLEFLRQFRSHGYEFPFVILTGHGDKMMTIQALQLGAFDFIDKPFREESLMNRLDAALRLGFQLRKIEEEVAKIVDPLKLAPNEAEQMKKVKRAALIAKLKSQIQ
jgi:DNA-binding NtrC family response regulator